MDTADVIPIVAADRAALERAKRAAAKKKALADKRRAAKVRKQRRAAKPKKSRSWEPTRAERKLVETATAAGMMPVQIGGILGHSPETLKKLCRAELDHGAAKCNAKVVGKLYEKCMKGDTIAMLFWCKTRMGWNDRQLVEHTGKDGGPIVYEAIKADADAFTQRIMSLAERHLAETQPLIEAVPLALEAPSPEPNEVN